MTPVYDQKLTPVSIDEVRCFFEEDALNLLIRRRLSDFGLLQFLVGLLRATYRYNFASKTRNFTPLLSKPIPYALISGSNHLWKNEDGNHSNIIFLL